MDIWMLTLTGGTWSVPVNLGTPLNSTGRDLQPAFAANDPDTMYFASDRGGQTGIYRSVFRDGAWGTPERVITGYVGEPSRDRPGRPILAGGFRVNLIY